MREVKSVRKVAGTRPEGSYAGQGGVVERLTVSMKCCRHNWMVRAVFPTPPSPSTTILCGVVNLDAMLGIKDQEGKARREKEREERERCRWPGAAVAECRSERRVRASRCELSGEEKQERTAEEASGRSEQAEECRLKVRIEDEDGRGPGLDRRCAGWLVRVGGWDCPEDRRAMDWLVPSLLLVIAHRRVVEPPK